jgi:hypothetical protein
LTPLQALTRDKVEILVETGDYLWAGLMAKSARMAKESEYLYRQGLGFYVDRGMFGRAIAAATALKLPQDEIDALFINGVETESQYLDPEQAEAMLNELVPDLQISMACWDQGTFYDAIGALEDYRVRRMESEDIDWPAEVRVQSESQTGSSASVERQKGA